ncbi:MULTISPECIES: molecular chaperone TorD family protein [Photobacterium]|uniref:Dehydrogenase n=1 Tax=Photobacterium aquimaris TaxID=512643 RepID=A0A2T3IGJ0_9GAMM|nr:MULTISPECIES: molecular chaperone TorD family protein [Photobacterium]PSU26094.1 dehydrogenase [Photobacterium aquimaris]PSW02168.1 dehydrogenase [Photobacterium aquimaris]
MFICNDMENVKVLSRIIGGLFYYHPSQYETVGINAVLALDNSGFSLFDKTTAAISATDPHTLSVWHDQLFTGVGEMAAPPWGSVYLDKESVVFGDSTLAFRHFLQQNGIEFEAKHNEPEDQFGLMVMVIASLIEDQRFEAVTELLSDHLLPWSEYYLQLLQQAAPVGAYRDLAELGQHFITELTQQFDAVKTPTKIYFNA